MPIILPNGVHADSYSDPVFPVESNHLYYVCFVSVTCFQDLDPIVKKQNLPM